MISSGQYSKDQRPASSHTAQHGENAVSGILLIDKPAGPTSHDIVDMIRRNFKIPKVGHGGTLDPAATGLLIILIGKGTKLSNSIIGSDKTYEGVMKLGISTDSQDADGKIIREADWNGITRAQLDEAINKFKGDIMQTPPMMSAIKVEGVPLYKSARKGKEVERDARLIHIYDFRVTDFSPPLVSFCVKCTKGTYIRTLCNDIGELLGCGAHLASLRRTQSGEFKIENAVELDKLLAMSDGQFSERIIPISRLPVSRRIV